MNTHAQATLAIQSWDEKPYLTEELSGITGTGAFAAQQGPTAAVELDYDFE